MKNLNIEIENERSMQTNTHKKNKRKKGKKSKRVIYLVSGLVEVDEIRHTLIARLNYIIRFALVQLKIFCLKTHKQTTFPSSIEIVSCYIFS